jgi:hypothetical protein
MRVVINPTLNLETMTWLPCVSYEYHGPVLLLKGDSTAQAAESTGAAFDQKLIDMFQAQYGKQQGIINYLQNLVTPIINKGGQGYTPEQLAAQRTAATDTISAQFRDAQAGVNAAAVRTGGSALPSGVSTMIESSLAPQEALAQSQAQEQITAANANLQQQNYWNAINVLNGQSAMLNPLGYASTETANAGTIAPLSNAVTSSQGPTALQVLGGLAGGAITGLGTAFTGSGTKAVFG